MIFSRGEYYNVCLYKSCVVTSLFTTGYLVNMRSNVKGGLKKKKRIELGLNVSTSLNDT